MLRFFAKFQRSRNLVLFAFCILLLIGLIAFYIPNTQLDPTSQYSSASAEDDTVIAKVGSQEITLKEFRGRLQQMGSSLGGRTGNNLPLTTLKQLGMDKQVLDQLIARGLTLDHAENLNLSGTDREIAEIIKAQFTDENGKFIGAEEYKRRLRLQGIDVGQFEQDRRDEITSRKVREFLTSAEQASDREVEEKYKKDNTKVEIVYTTLDLDKVRQKYKPSEEDLKAYYDTHQGEFKATAPTRKVDYIFISTDDVAKIVPVSEEELRKEYENRKQFEFRASIIKMNVLTPDDETTVKSKIDDLNRRVRGGQGGQPEDFATLAKGNSQDPSAAKGGDLGWIKKEPNKTKDWRQRPYTGGLKVGDIDGPFRDGQSWYILKVTEQREVPFAQMRDTIKATVSNNAAFQKASQLADLAYEKATEYKDLRKAAEEVAKVVKVSPDSLLKSTPYFKSGDSFEVGKGSGRSNVPAFENAVSTLKKGEIGEKVSIPGGQAVPQVVDVIENGQQLSFDQARNQVEDKIRSEKEPLFAQTKAQEIINQAKNPDDFQRLAKAEGLEVKTDTNFNTYNFPGMASGGAGMQASNQARMALMTLKEGEVYKTPIKVGASYLIFAATKRTEADLSKLPAQRDGIRQSIISERQQVTFEAFVKSARKLYEQQGKIKIYQDRIDKFFSSLATEQ
jgi:peptidyl-prolyl cis-trans isomerase D